MFGPKLDSKSYTTFLLIVIGVLLSLNLFAQITPPIRDPAVDERYDSTAVYREMAVSNQAVATATTQVAAANQAIAQALQAIATSIDAKREFDLKVVIEEDGTAPAARPLAAAPVTATPTTVRPDVATPGAALPGTTRLDAATPTATPGVRELQPEPVTEEPGRIEFR